MPRYDHIGTVNYLKLTIRFALNTLKLIRVRNYSRIVF